jgi:hypothetical protein
MTTLARTSARIAAHALALLALLGTTAPAQGTTVDPRWQAWTGCWRAVADQPESPPGSESIDIGLTTLRLLATPGAGARTATASVPQVCVIPASGRSAVQIVTIDSGRVIARDTIDASGQQVSVSRDGCTGWRRSSWSADGRRVYLRSEMDCTGGLHRSSSAMLAIAPTSEWLDVQGLRVSGNTAVRTRRYYDAGIATGLPADVAAAIAAATAGRQLAISTARASVGGQVLANDVIDATRNLDSSVVQAWLVERGQRFDVNAKQLVALAKAGVPGSVTDAMIAVSYPQQFELRRGPVSDMYGDALTRSDSARIASEYLYSRCSLGYDPFWYSPCGFGYDGLYSYGRYGSRYGYGYGYSPYGYGGAYYGGYTYYVPVIVERGVRADHGQVVKGQGYTRGRSSGSSSGSGASRSSGSAGSSSSSGSSKSGSSGSTGSSGSSAGSTSTGRTAHPRP